MKLFPTKRRIVAAVVVVIALFLIRPGASHLKSRIIYSISTGVGRPVDIGSVHIRLLPRPGFDLENLVVYDDPAFGAEPILRAGEVTADLRLISLLRGRIEIARLDLSEPSLNLALREGGRWNLEALVERAAHTPSAPTAKGKSEPRPAFPYIEGSSGRINFKVGPEKKPYALTNADFSLWQESENSWGVRLKAQPFRSDMNLNDTGQLQVNGIWQRANALRETPLQFTIEWTKAQLGQLTKFASGNDWGWRGAVQVDVALSGTPGKLHVITDASLDDFRRYDLTSARSLRMAAHCEAEYGSATREFHQIACNAPVGEGRITVSGDVGLPSPHQYDVEVTAEGVPAGAAASLLQRIKKDLPDDLAAQGTLQAKLSIHHDANSGVKPHFDGEGEIAGLRLSSASNKAEIGPETIPFSFSDSAMLVRGRPPRTIKRMPEAAGRHIEIGPIMLAARAGGPTARGWINHLGYNFTIAGEADIPRALRLARMFGVPVPASAADGSAQLDLQVEGPWAGTTAAFAGPQVTGMAKLKNVRVPPRELGGPAEIVLADMQLSANEVKLGKLIVKAAGSTWTGTIEIPRGCGTLEECPPRAVLNADEVGLSQLNEWANPSPKRPWYQVLGTNPQRGNVLARLQATAEVNVGRLRMGKIEATHVSAVVTLDKGKLDIPQLSADFLGGKHRGMWSADFRAKPALCIGRGALAGVSLTQLENSINDGWIAGTGSGSYELEGACAAEFWQLSTGTMTLDLRGGALPRVLLGDDPEPLVFTRLKGTAQLDSGKLKIADATLDSPNGKYELSGTASLSREINVKLTRPGNGTMLSGYAITGTVSKPKVVLIPHTEQAQLKTALRPAADK